MRRMSNSSRMKAPTTAPAITPALMLLPSALVGSSTATTTTDRRICPIRNHQCDNVRHKQRCRQKQIAVTITLFNCAFYLNFP